MLNSTLEWLRAGAEPELVWGLVPRIVGLFYAVAFVSLGPQVLGLIGSRGISPVRQQLAAAREHFPGPLRFLRFPTLLWLGASDRVLRVMPWVGALCGLYAVIGGPGSWIALLGCWAIYLSLDGCALMFPWDCLLMEAGFLALFLPEQARLPALMSAELPLPVVAFAWRLFLVRVMWGFAKVKFIGTKRGDSLYLRGFLAWMPMCNPLGFKVQHAPAWFLRVGYGFMWLVEVVCPGLVFFGGLPRALGALGLVSLMLAIAVTGNWGFFNLAYGALCIVLLDTQSSLFDTSLELIISSPSALFTHVVMAVMLFGALLYFPANSWATHNFLHWPFENVTWKRPLLRALIAFYRALSPFRILHAYGVFPPNSMPPIKVLPVFEGSVDGRNFEAYGYRYIVSTETSRPPIVAPHHPRIDHLCVFAALGTTESDYLATVAGAGKPFGFSPFSHFSWLHRLAERLLEGEPSVLRLLGHNPFRAEPPKFVRVSLRALTPTSLDESRRTGRFWRVRDLGVMFAARPRCELVHRHWLAPPELLHPDLVHWRKKSPALAAMVNAYAHGVPHEQAVRIESDLTAEEVERFWDEFVPQVAATRGDFERIDETASAVHAHFGLEAILRFERIAERYAFLLRLVLEPYFYGDHEPRIPTRTHFRFYLLLHELILDGRRAYEGWLREPGSVAARSAQQSEASELQYIGVVRNETIRYHGRSLRISRRITSVTEGFIPGILEFKDLLTAHAPPGETWLPRCERTDSGVWTCDGFVLAEARDSGPRPRWTP